MAEAVPRLFRGRRVAVSALDSGPLRLTPDDVATGWRRIGDRAVSPESPDPSSLPQGGWSEWYVFEGEPSPRTPEVFVNVGGFTPQPDRANEWRVATADRFWAQLAEWWPESYLADGDSLICVTRLGAAVPELERVFGVSVGRQPA